MRYEILGPLRVRTDSAEHTVSAPKVEVLFATLLIRANQVVPADQLLTELWDGDLPKRACAGLYVYVSQLRKFLVHVGKVRNPIQTRAPGYLLSVEPGELDLAEFQSAVYKGRRLLESGNSAQAAQALEGALGLWRGTAFGGLRGGPLLRGFTTWLEEARLECSELLVKALLAQGRYQEAVSRLYSLVAENPLRETFYQLLMLALYRSSRPADALRVYQQARTLIIDEIGLEPCRALRDLHQAILLEDTALDDRVAI
jgi:SARP family transcriptional regulator, regulator of embCAB operon